MIKNIHEILEEFEKASSKKEKIEVLQKNADRGQLKNVLQGTFHPGIKFVFKEPIDYKRSDAPIGLGYSNFDTEMKRIYLFVEGSKKVDPNLSFERKRQLAIQILESLEEKEANVFMNMLLKDLKVKGLTAKVVEDAFPGLIS